MNNHIVDYTTYHKLILHEWNCTSLNQHQGREISASRALEIIAISIIFQWKLPKKGGSYITFFRNFSIENFFSAQSLFSLAQYLHYIFKQNYCISPTKTQKHKIATIKSRRFTYLFVHQNSLYLLLYFEVPLFPSHEFCEVRGPSGICQVRGPSVVSLLQSQWCHFLEVPITLTCPDPFRHKTSLS
jgi:hypothetical protein